MLVEEQKQKRHWLRFRTQVTGKSLTNQDFFNKTIADKKLHFVLYFTTVMYLLLLCISVSKNVSYFLKEAIQHIHSS